MVNLRHSVSITLYYPFDLSSSTSADRFNHFVPKFILSLFVESHLHDFTSSGCRVYLAGSIGDRSRGYRGGNEEEPFEGIPGEMRDWRGEGKSRKEGGGRGRKIPDLGKKQSEPRVSLGRFKNLLCK